MRMHAEQGFRGQVVDLDTGQPVRKVIWLDDVLGELEAYQTDQAGRIRTDRHGQLLTFRARGRFRFFPHQDAREGPRMAPGGRRTVRMGAPACAICGCVLTLLGDDLCPACRAKDRGQRHPMTRVAPINPLEIRWCSHPGCRRRAAWMVGDEVEVTPEKVGRILYERGAMVGRRSYCSWHYASPRLLDPKGEVIEELPDMGVRPD